LTLRVTVYDERGAVYSRLTAKNADEVARLVIAWADNVATRGFSLKLEASR
jgi:hypothetical protein